MAGDARFLVMGCIRTLISGREAPATIIDHVPTRQRQTELEREIARRSTAMSLSLGRDLREARTRLSMTQRAVAAKVGISQTAWSRIERGLGGQVPLQTWVALGIALDRPLAVNLTRALGDTRGPADAGHLDIQEHVLRLARATGRHGTFELPTRPSDPARSTDVGLRDDRHRALIQVECWNSFGDFGAAIRDTNRKAAEATAHAIATASDDDPYRVATVWVVRATAANRRLFAAYPHIVDAAFPGSSRGWLQALEADTEPPRDPGVVWYDPATRRLTEHRRATMPRDPNRRPP
jgi:transcriptional regulator with XRE-family HTH domain